MQLSIIVPCFNEGDTVGAVLDEIAGAVATLDVEHEIIAVDDGSSDDTGAVLAASAAVTRVITHKSNRGYGASIKDGMRAASHDWILVMDGDGQHDPAGIAALIEEAEGSDMVVGARTAQGSHHWRLPGKLILKTLCQFLVGQRIPDINSGFRLFRLGEARKYVHLCSDQFSFSTSITLAFLSDRLSVRFVPVNVRARQGGESQVRIRTGFSTFMLILRIIGTFNPLPIFMPLTLLLFTVGGMLALWELIVSSNVGDAAVLCLVGGLMLFCFGLLADQLALLRREINKN